METTPYFNEVVLRNHPEAHRSDWIEAILAAPMAVQPEPNGSIRYWGFVDEVGKYMRVVLDSDARTLHNAFFDRTFARQQSRGGE